MGKDFSKTQIKTSIIIPTMSLRNAALVWLMLSAAGTSAAADLSYLSLNPNAGHLRVKGYPVLTKNTNVKVTGPAFVPAYLAVIDADGKGKSCNVQSGWEIRLSTKGQPYATVAITNPPTVTAIHGVFSSIQSNQASTLEATDAGDEFTVFDGQTQRCKDKLGTTLDTANNQYLKLSDSPPSNLQSRGEYHPLVDGDPPMPILGSSWRMVATGNTKFTCAGNSPAQKATLKDFPGLATLSMGDENITPPAPYLNLAGINDWKITTYPQQVEIRPSRFWESGGLTISAPGKQLQCGADGKTLTFVQAGVGRPQEFVVDWSPSWFDSRRTVTIPCGTNVLDGCILRLNPPKKN